MTNPFARGTLVLLLVLGGCGGDDDAAPGATSTTATTTAAPVTTTPGSETTSSTAAGRVVEVTVRNGAVEGGVRRETVNLGERVVLRVHSDTADEVHVHGHDLSEPVAAGGTAEVAFTADIPGLIEVELEEAKLPILELEVR